MSLVDVVFITHLNSEKRIKLFVQTFESYIANTDFSLVSSTTLIDDCSPVKIEVEVPQVAYIRNETQRGVGYSKNLGINKGTAKFVYSSDTDVYFTPGWLSKMIEAYTQFNVISPFKLGILGGGCHPFLQTNRSVVTGDYQVDLKDAVSGWSWFFRRTLWDSFGKLHDHALGSGQSEDWEYCQRIRPNLCGSLVPEIIYHCGITNTENNPVMGAELFPRPEGVILL